MPPDSTAADDRIALRTVAERRHRVIRSIVSVAFVSLVMVVLAAMNRDRAAIDACEDRMRDAVRELQDKHKQWLKDTSQFPLDIVRKGLGDVVSDGSARDTTPSGVWNSTVFENSRFTEQAAFMGAVGVCCCERPHGRLFRPGLRHVIVYKVREEAYGLVTLEEGQFAQQADGLGLGGALLLR